MVADIEKAFLQIRLQDDAKDVTGFFWLKDRDKLEVKNNIQIIGSVGYHLGSYLAHFYWQPQLTIT